MAAWQIYRGGTDSPFGTDPWSRPGTALLLSGGVHKFQNDVRIDIILTKSRSLITATTSPQSSPSKHQFTICLALPGSSAPPPGSSLLAASQMLAFARSTLYPLSSTTLAILSLPSLAGSWRYAKIRRIESGNQTLTRAAPLHQAPPDLCERSQRGGGEVRGSAGMQRCAGADQPAAFVEVPRRVGPASAPNQQTPKPCRLQT
jgi:hypothetical protein